MLVLLVLLMKIEMQWLNISELISAVLFPALYSLNSKIYIQRGKIHTFLNLLFYLFKNVYFVAKFFLLEFDII